MVEKTIVLPEGEYQHFTKNLLKEYDFIRKNTDLMYESDGVLHCLLVAGRESREGILVDSEGSGYARYSALIPDASPYIQTQYASLRELEKRLADAVDFIIREGTWASTNGGYLVHSEEWMKQFGIHETWKNLVCDMLSEREEVQKVSHLGNGFQLCFDTRYCPHAAEEVETMNQQINL